MSGLITFGDDYAFDLLTMFYYSSREAEGGEGVGKQDGICCFFCLRKVKKDYSCPWWERKSWGVAMVFALTMFLHPSRLALGRSRRLCKIASGTLFPYLLLSSLNFPHRRGPGTESQAFVKAWVCFPQFQGLVVSTCYNFGEVGIRQRLPSLSTGGSH